MPGRRPSSRPIVDPREPAAASAGGRRQRSGAGPVVRASELGAYAYCERAWWLRYIAGQEPTSAGQARLEGGHSRHAEHGQGVWRATLLRRLGLVCVALAAAVAAVWLLTALLAH